jgi:hypothetical protein
MLRRLLAVALSLALVAGLSACGNKQSQTLTADTEGVYVDVGNLKYQVEISRTLNAADPEDAEYLKGVTTQLGTEDVWFAVFVRVENDTNKVQHPATQFDIVDTLNNVFNPVAIDLKSNDFGYSPVSLPGKSLLPNVDAIASQNSIGGQLLLFKMPRQTLDNRPLELKIHDPADFQTVGTVNLDV